jgi:hypothetical protein
VWRCGLHRRLLVLVLLLLVVVVGGDWAAPAHDLLPLLLVVLLLCLRAGLLLLPKLLLVLLLLELGLSLGLGLGLGRGVLRRRDARERELRALDRLVGGAGGTSHHQAAHHLREPVAAGALAPVPLLVRARAHPPGAAPLHLLLAEGIWGGGWGGRG